MHNDPELNGKYLGTISQDFILLADNLKEASYQLRKQNFEFPIFPICKEEQPIGQLFVERDRAGNQWHYYISFLDEFVQRGLVEEDKKEQFMQAYKDPDEFCCLFVVDQSFTNFVFIPYPED